MDFNNKTTLFWSLVIGIFLIVLLFWIPSFIKSIGTLVQSVGSQTSESSTEIEDTLTPQIEELKKSFDTLMKQVPQEQQPSQQQPTPAPTPSALPTSTTSEQEQPIVTPEQYCRAQGGIHQLRQNNTNGSYAVCIFTDGSECEQTMFQKGECKKGQTQTAEDLIL